MLKYLLTLVLSVAAFTVAVAEASEPRTAVAMTLADGEIVMMAALRESPPRARESTVTPQQAKPPAQDEVSWKMVLAAVALMAAVAMRRLGSGPR